MSTPQTFCMICFQLSPTISVTKCCSKVICNACHQQIKKIGNKCPNCRNINLETQKQSYVQQINKNASSSNSIQFQTNCLVCHQLAHEALVITCCGSLVCSSCKSQQQGKPCFECRKTQFSLKQEVFVRKFLIQISKDVQFYVKTMTGTSILLKMKEFQQARILFNRVSQKEGVPLGELRLTCNGKQLAANQKTLKHYGIQKLSTVHMLIRQRGGK